MFHSMKPDFYLQIKTERRTNVNHVNWAGSCLCVCSYCKRLDVVAEQVVHHILRQQRLQLVDVTLALELQVTHHFHTEANTCRKQSFIRLRLSPTSSLCFILENGIKHHSLVCQVRQTVRQF